MDCANPELVFKKSLVIADNQWNNVIKFHQDFTASIHSNYFQGQTDRGISYWPNYSVKTRLSIRGEEEFAITQCVISVTQTVLHALQLSLKNILIVAFFKNWSKYQIASRRECFYCIWHYLFFYQSRSFSNNSSTYLGSVFERMKRCGDWILNTDIK